MKYTTKMKLTPIYSALILTTVSAIDAAVISVNFDNGSNSIAGSLGAVESVANWNAADIGAAGSPVSTLNLLDDSGAVTTADIALENQFAGAAGGFAAAVDGGSGDLGNLFTYRNRNGGVIGTVSQLDITNFATYDVYVYFNRNGATPTESYDITLGATTFSVTTNNTAAAFTEANAGNSFTGNYVVFQGVTGTSFTVTAGDSGQADYIYGMQIVSVPEPSSTALLGLGGLALILRRRK